jgi:hypothetical protein
MQHPEPFAMAWGIWAIRSGLAPAILAILAMFRPCPSAYGGKRGVLDMRPTAG